MTSVAFDGIPSEFDPSIINRDDFSDSSLKTQVQQVFNGGPNEEGIYLLDGYEITRLTNGNGWDCISNVGDALRIQQLIENYDFGDCIRVANQYLYSHQNIIFAIKEKLELSDEAPQLHKATWKELREKYDPSLSDRFTGISPERQKLIKKVLSVVDKGFLQTARPISVKQALARTIFTFEHDLNLSILETFFTTDGEVAIIGSQLGHKPPSESSLLYKIFGDGRLTSLKQSFLETAKLRACIEDPEVRDVVTNTENNYLGIYLVKTVVVAAFLALAWSYSSAIPIAALHFLVKSVVLVKAITLAFQNTSFYLNEFQMSRYGNVPIS